jgi:NAD(P)-dependent dehydrogenase (short-subunit alcohol dehydrogenase family)
LPIRRHTLGRIDAEALGLNAARRDAWDIAEACVYLLASSGKFITGEVLTVDGGQQMWGDPWPTGRPEWFRT